MSVPLSRVYIDLSRLCLTPFTTGIQRVAKAVVRRMLQNPQLEVILLCALPSQTAWRILPHEAFLAYCRGTCASPYGSVPFETVAPSGLCTGSAFFDIDSAWNMPMQRGWLYPRLRERGIIIICHLYDLIPVTEPQYFHRNTAVQFWAWLSAALQYGAHIICNAEATKIALHQLCHRLDVQSPPCTVVPLGGDFTRRRDTDPEKLPETLSPYRYLLMVGTIEPRKNHKLLLQAVDALAERKISVVFAGRIGWRMEQFAVEMKRHPLNGKTFFFFDSPSDAMVHALYENALAVVFPTKNEGFGLPIVEAFRFGTPVLAADLPVLREVGGELADYFDNESVASLLAAVDHLRADEQAYFAKRAQIAAYCPHTWNDTANAMADTLCTAAPMHGTAKTSPLRQLAVLTARNEDLLRSLPYWDAYYPFAEEVLVCCPAENVAELQTKWRGRLRLRFCTDETLLQGDPLPKDHTKRNFYLRCRMMRYAPLDDVFLMTDDDYRPLQSIEEAVFRKQGRYCAYYCYDLRQWRGTQEQYTSYDQSMFRTRTFLESEHLPTLQYSSHQPQIIDRALYLALLDEYPHIMHEGLDEWSVYFNYGVARYPTKFSPSVYCTMCWPGAMTDWKLWVFPKHLYFENFYGILYETGGVFEGLPQGYDPHTAQTAHMEKIHRWHTALRSQSNLDVAGAMQDASYTAFYRMPPQYMLTTDENGSPRFTLPQTSVLICGALARLTLQIENALRMDGATLQYNIQTPDGGEITPVQTIFLRKTESSQPLTLIISAPRSPITGLLVLEYLPHDNAKGIRGVMPCVVTALPDGF